MLSGIVGITCNIILFLLKFLAGIITGAVSVAADAFNNLSDAGSSIVTFIGFKVSGKPADTEHPFGHGRIEYISGLIVAAAIIVMGVELFRSSVARIFSSRGRPQCRSCPARYRAARPDRPAHCRDGGGGPPRSHSRCRPFPGGRWRGS